MWNIKGCLNKIKDGYQLYGFLLVTGLCIIYARTAYAVLDPVMYTEDGTWTASLIYNGFLNIWLSVMY